MPSRLNAGRSSDRPPSCRRILAALPLALAVAIAGPAAAASKGRSQSETVAHPFVGAWGTSAAACADHDDFYVNTLIGRTRFVQYELECTITNATRSSSAWTLALVCQREGDSPDMSVRLIPNGDDRLAVEIPNEPPQHLRRCTGPVPTEYRSILDD